MLSLSLPFLLRHSPDCTEHPLRSRPTARLCVEFEKRQRFAFAAIQRDRDREKAEAVSRLHEQAVDKDRIIENAVVTIKKLSFASQTHKAENEKLSAEIDRLRAMLRARQIGSSAMSFR